MSGTTVQPGTSVAAARTGHPLGFWFFFWGEFAERCSFYGMKTILPIYLTEVFLFSDVRGSQIMTAFKMTAYCLPLLGGFLADRFFGKYWTIVGFSVPYVVGHFILGNENRIALLNALALLAGGSGVIKPNISTLMGQTYDERRPGQRHLRSSAFLWFYFAINFGALLSTAVLPELRKKEFDFATIFQVPAWLMVAALLVFAAGKPHYARETLVHERPSPAERRERWQTLSRLFGVFGLIVFFWVAYEHSDAIWVYFIRDYTDLNVNWHFTIGERTFGMDVMGEEQLQLINPLCVIIFAPLFATTFKIIDPKMRVFTATNKILIGFLLGVAASGTLSVAAALASETHKVSIMWPASAYVFLTIGEVLVYGTGLELAYSAAPESMKGFITGCFLVTNTVANFINIGLSPLYGGSLKDPLDKRGPLSASEFFGMMALIVLVATIAFYFVGRRLDRPTEDTAASAS
jgi:POT family proton-dependent oligopeptide transporter